MADDSGSASMGNGKMILTALAAAAEAKTDGLAIEKLLEKVGLSEPHFTDALGEREKDEYVTVHRVTGAVLLTDRGATCHWKRLG